MNTHLAPCVLGLAAILTACSSGSREVTGSDLSEAVSQPEVVIMPSIGSRRAPRTLSPQARAAAAAPAASTGNGIDYHGGPIMAGTVNLYYIWYGNWSGKSAPSILNDWGNAIGGSPIFGINSTYWDNSGNSVSGSVRLAGSTSVGYTHGNSINGDAVWSIVDDALSGGQLPSDPNGVYFVLTSADVDETEGFCTSFCGWHTARSRSGTYIKYAFVGDAARCNGSCGSGPSPNDDVSGDSMASIMFHELSEAVSDPLVNAWSDSTGAENGDKCAWNFGATYSASNGSRANVHLGNRDYLLQQMWLNANGGSCQLSGPTGGTSNSLPAGSTLTANQAIVSPDGRFKAIMQPDSNFVVYQGSTALWATGLAGGTRATMQTDGNFVLYDASNRPVWASNTYGSGGSELVMQSDGNLVIYTASGAPVWASNTCCR